MRLSFNHFYPIFTFYLLLLLLYPGLAEAYVPSLVESIRFEKPVFFCGNEIPMERRGVRERAEKEVLLALWNRPQVILWMKRSSKYFPHIEKILNEHDLPADLKYVAVIESALRPHVTSSKGALGFWQFLKSTGRRYHLRIDGLVDERRNIFKSTRAACLYLKELYARFHSWPLALSAYNMGENSLAKQIKIQKTDDFYSLYLSLETRRYFFKAVAAKMIFEKADKYGFLLKGTDYYPLFTFDRVSFKSSRQIPLTLIAQAADVSFKVIKDMNPEIRGYSLSRGENSVLIPKGSADNFKKKFEKIYPEWERSHSQRYHRVKQGENLSMIARKYGVSLFSLLKWNNLSRKSILHPGDSLVIKAD